MSARLAAKLRNNCLKEFVREWLMENGFQGKDGQQIPEMTDEVIKGISDRYIELYEHVTGKKFVKEDVTDEEMKARLETELEHLPPVPSTIGTL